MKVVLQTILLSTFVAMRFTFKKAEKLKSKKLIEKLFTEGKSITNFPIKLIYLKTDHKGNFPVQAGFSVPKRKVQLATQRNKIKRLLRESYRTQKHLIYNDIQEKYIFMFLYLDENSHKYVLLEGKMKILLAKFLGKIKKDS